MPVRVAEPLLGGEQVRPGQVPAQLAGDPLSRLIPVGPGLHRAAYRGDEPGQPGAGLSGDEGHRSSCDLTQLNRMVVTSPDCPTLTGFAATPERFIEVDWNYSALSGGDRSGGKSPHHTARLSVIGANEPTALANLTNAIAKQEGSVSSLKIVSRQPDFIEALVDVDVRDVAHLSKVIAGLRGAVGVKGVERG